MIGVAILGGCVVAAGVRFWFYERLPRPTAWVLAFGFFLLGIGIPVWTDALASLTASQNGQYALVGILFLSGLCFYVEGVHKPRKAKLDENSVVREAKPDHYHRVTTMATAAVFGTALVVAKIRWHSRSILTKHSPLMIKQALNQDTARVNSGAMSISHSERLVVLLGAFLIFAALVALFIAHERSQPRNVSKRESRERKREAVKAKREGGGRSGRAMRGGQGPGGQPLGIGGPR